MFYKTVLLSSVLLLSYIRVMDAAVFRKGPYIIYPGVNTEMKVLWQSNGTPSTSSTIEWGTTSSYGNGPYAVKETGTGTDEHQFSYLITGLMPGEKIFYRVTVDGVKEASLFYAAPPTGVTDVTFYAYGDMRSRAGSHNSVCAQLMNDVNKQPGLNQTMVLNSGDWVSDGDYEDQWDGQYFNRSAADALKMMSSLAVMGCRGNHERKGLLLRKYWPYDYQDPSGSYYAFDYGPVLVAIVDQYVNYDIGSEQYNWLSYHLTNTAAQWKIVVFHAPAFSAGSGHANSGSALRIVPLMQSKGVDVVVNGHNHYYSRCVVNGVQHITTGGGGTYLKTPDLNYEPYKQYGVKADESLHFVKFAVKGGTMTVSAIRDNGSVIETFDLTKDITAIAPAVKERIVKTIDNLAALPIDHGNLPFRISVFSVTGAKVRDMVIINENDMVNATVLRTGIYFIQVAQYGTTQLYKFINLPE